MRYWGLYLSPPLPPENRSRESHKRLPAKPGRGTPLYGLYRYVRPQRVWFLVCFGHKFGIDFSHFAGILVINRVSIFAL